MNNNIQDHLIESLKKNQNNYHLSNIIGANHQGAWPNGKASAL